MKTKALFPGSFDPLTNGHLDLIKRASKDYAQLIILLGTNHRKESLLTIDERVEIINQVLISENLDNVIVTRSDELVAKYCFKHQITIVIRGLRNNNDFLFEQDIAYNNMYLNPNLNTVFYLSKPEHLHISSSGVKEILKFNESISSLVHPIVEDRIKEKYENIQ